MSNMRGAVRTPSGSLVFKLNGWVMVDGTGQPVNVCVVAKGRMEAIERGRSLGLREVKLDLQDPPDSDAAHSADESEDGAVWEEWPGGCGWLPIASLPK